MGKGGEKSKSAVDKHNVVTVTQSSHNNYGAKLYLKRKKSRGGGG